MQPFLAEDAGSVGPRERCGHEVANLDGADGDCVVGVHDCDLVVALEFGYGALRDNDGVLLGANYGANFSVATGAQDVGGIIKESGDADGSGAFVNLAIGKVEHAFERIGGTIGENQLEFEIFVGFDASFFCGEALAPGEILRLADGEIDLYGIDSGNGSDGTAGRIYEGADLQGGLPGDSVDGCDEAGKFQIDFGGFDGSFESLNLSLGGLHGGLGSEVILDGVVQVLLAGGLFSGERCVAVYVQLRADLNGFGIGKGGSRLSQLAEGLVNDSLKWARVNLEKELAFFYVGTFLITLLHQVAGDLSADVGIDQAVESANPFTVNGDVSLLDFNDLNFNGSCGGRARRLFGATGSDDHHNERKAEYSTDPKFVLREHIYLLGSLKFEDTTFTLPSPAILGRHGFFREE